MFRYTLVTQSEAKRSEIERAIGIQVQNEFVELPEIQAIDLETVCEEKAKVAYTKIGNKPVMIEDTGIFIDAWNGFPGALTKWILNTIGVDGMCKMLDAFSSRNATAKTAIALFDGKQYRVFIGEITGSISHMPIGTNGFGWDSIFIPSGTTKTFAQMEINEKMNYSMRQHAVNLMLDQIKNEAVEEATMPLKKYKYRDLHFVSTSEGKFLEFKKSMGIGDLKWANIQIVEPQILELHALVEEKVKAVRLQLKDKPFFVEHSGLFVDILRGLPGGMTSPFMKRMTNEGLCKLLSSFPDDERTARGCIAIGLYHPEFGLTVFTAETHGKIVDKPRGTNNFGWDPIFIPRKREGDEYYEKTYGEMSLEEKSETDMRTKAVGQLMDHLKNYFSL